MMNCSGGRDHLKQQIITNHDIRIFIGVGVSGGAFTGVLMKKYFN
jgi:hypothetical protein